MSDQNPKVKAVFGKALEIESHEERSAYLDEACGDETQLRREVEDLLEAIDQAGSFMARPVMEPQATLDQPITEKPGTQIGPYKLLQQLGEGGMGVVYMAEQKEPVKRRVALKIIKPGMDTRQVIARFEAERQALAMMDHPNIAKVLDAGATESGRPYFVMELVNGLPVTKYCDEQHLTPKERLELFVPICQAVQHAHQKGIIHRDLKPSNILIAMYDNKAVPKIIDFGVAKATSQTLTDKTMFTQLGQVVGTLEYMSPEQAQRNQLDIDTRSDIYSLGVVLYELLTGETPFDRERLRSAAFDEMLRIIREEEPSKPSTKVSSSLSLASIAANRRIEPAKLGSMIRGELDWIVLKAMEKDRGRRYETASKFAEDVQHYLNDEPVVACPPSNLYRFHKFVRRNRAPLTVVAMLSVVILAVVGSIGWIVSDRARQRREHAARQEMRQERLSAQIASILEDVSRLARLENWPAALEAAQRAEALADAGDAVLQTRDKVSRILADLRFVRRLEEIRLELSAHSDGVTANAVADRAYARAFRAWGVDVEQVSVEQAGELLNARTMISPALGVALDNWASARAIATDAPREKSWRLYGVATIADPDAVRNQLRSIWKAPPTESSITELKRLASSEQIRQQPSSTLIRLGSTLDHVGAKQEGLEILRLAQERYPQDFWASFQLAIALQQQVPPSLEALRFFGAAAALRPESFWAHNNIGCDLLQHGKTTEAIACFRQATVAFPDESEGFYNLGVVLRREGQLDEAIVCFRKAVVLNPTEQDGQINLGTTLRDTGQLDDALTPLREAIALNPEDAEAHALLGDLLARLENAEALTEAVAQYREAVRLAPGNAEFYVNLGGVLAEQHLFPEAVAALRKAVELDPDLAAPRGNLGNSLARLGQLEEAEIEYREALRLKPDEFNFHYGLGCLLSRRKKWTDAEHHFYEALQLAPTNAAARLALGTTFWQQKKWPEAETQYRHAIAINPEDAVSHHALGFALEQQLKLREALTEYVEADRLDPRYVKTRAETLGNCHRFVLACVYATRGEALMARTQYDIALAWMVADDKRSQNAKVLEARRLAEELLGIREGAEDKTADTPLPNENPTEARQDDKSEAERVPLLEAKEVK